MTNRVTLTDLVFDTDADFSGELLMRLFNSEKRWGYSTLEMDLAYKKILNTSEYTSHDFGDEPVTVHKVAMTIDNLLIVAEYGCDGDSWVGIQILQRYGRRRVLQNFDAKKSCGWRDTTYE